ncbi:MAG: hypothetical protein A2167_03690 [Planctomycetes bacterium RBG_13_46_10]|nr:MAG: hypothetical protein A2167_03690 [Planctomycetes bacterium RBG_13_46_10]
MQDTKPQKKITRLAMAPVAMVCSTIVENVLQIGLFLQIFRPGSRRDKANFRKAKINISSLVTRE